MKLLIRNVILHYEESLRNKTIKGSGKYKVVYISYWEISEQIDPVEIAKLGMKMSELSDIEGAETISWIVTPDYWGISLMKVENEAAAFKVVTRWRVAMPVIFKK